MKLRRLCGSPQVGEGARRHLLNDAQQPIAGGIDEVARMLYALCIKVERGGPLLST